MKTAVYRVAIDAKSIDEFTLHCLEAGWRVLDTGERIATDEGEDAEAVLLLTVLVGASPRRNLVLSH